MAEAVANVRDKGLGFAENLEKRAHDVDVGSLRLATDVVDLILHPTARAHRPQCRGVIRHVQPVTHVAAVTVDRKRLIAEGTGDHEGDELLRELIWSVVVRTASGYARQSKRLGIGAHQAVSTCLARRVGAVWSQRMPLAEGRVIGGERTVDLVGADIDETEVAWTRLELGPHALEQVEGSLNVGRD